LYELGVGQRLKKDLSLKGMKQEGGLFFWGGKEKTESRCPWKPKIGEVWSFMKILMNLPNSYSELNGKVSPI